MGSGLVAAFVAGLWIGLSIAAPVGPIGLLVIQRTLQQGLAPGLATGLGAALADACYGAVGALGVAALISWLQGLRVPMVLAGGALMLWLAWRTWHAPLGADSAPAAGAAAVPARAGWWPSLAGSFALTLSNPATVLSFVAVYGTLSAQPGVAASPAVWVAGVLAGSALWWLLLCAVVARLRTRVGVRVRRLLSRGSALMLAGFALVQWALLARGVPG